MLFYNATTATIEVKIMPSLFVRLSDELHSKLRVIAALKSESLNATMIAAASLYIDTWEEKYGALPLPPKDIE